MIQTPFSYKDNLKMSSTSASEPPEACLPY